jgi:hypothetical protein
MKILMCLVLVVLTSSVCLGLAPVMGNNSPTKTQVAMSNPAFVSGLNLLVTTNLETQKWDKNYVFAYGTDPKKSAFTEAMIDFYPDWIAWQHTTDGAGVIRHKRHHRRH